MAREDKRLRVIPDLGSSVSLHDPNYVLLILGLGLSCG